MNKANDIFSGLGLEEKYVKMRDEEEDEEEEVQKPEEVVIELGDDEDDKTNPEREGDEEDEKHAVADDAQQESHKLSAGKEGGKEEEVLRDKLAKIIKKAETISETFGNIKVIIPCIFNDTCICVQFHVHARGQVCLYICSIYNYVLMFL